MSISTEQPNDIGGRICGWSVPARMWAVCADQAVPRGFPSATPLFPVSRHAGTVLCGPQGVVIDLFVRTRARLLTSHLLRDDTDERSAMMLLACWCPTPADGLILTLETPGANHLQDMLLDAAAEDAGIVQLERHEMFNPAHLMNDRMLAISTLLNAS